MDDRRMMAVASTPVASASPRAATSQGAPAAMGAFGAALSVQTTPAAAGAMPPLLPSADSPDPALAALVNAEVPTDTDDELDVDRDVAVDSEADATETVDIGSLAHLFTPPRGAAPAASPEPQPAAGVTPMPDAAINAARPTRADLMPASTDALPRESAASTLPGAAPDVSPSAELTPALPNSPAGSPAAAAAATATETLRTRTQASATPAAAMASATAPGPDVPKPVITEALLAQPAGTLPVADTISSVPGLTGSAAAGTAAAMPAPAPAAAPTLPTLPVTEAAPMLAEHIEAMVDDEVWQMKLRLDPPRLGTVEVQLAVRDQQVAVSLGSGDAQARLLLAQALPELANALAARGLQLMGADVGHPSQGRDEAPARRLAQNARSEAGDAESAPARVRAQQGVVDHYA